MNNKVYFPDFVCGKIIIECTYWKGLHKIPSLMDKISNFEYENYSVFVIVPKALRSFYKPIENNIVYLKELVEQRKLLDKIQYI
ncbi:MAG: hypothetical protein NTY48_00555 [Candidatus Diapherotrites archaeon]|nr:hypothetical protein [Candidatus Diapherotrites archaeon]